MGTLTPRLDAAEVGYRMDGQTGAISMTAADIRRADHPRETTHTGVDCSLLYCSFGNAADRHSRKREENRRALLENGEGSEKGVTGGAVLMGSGMHYSSRHEMLMLRRVVDAESMEAFSLARVPVEGMDECYKLRGSGWDDMYTAFASNDKR